MMSAREMPEEQAGPDSRAEARSILVVEDEVIVRMALADELRRAGYAVIEAANADEALQVLCHTDHVRLVISDIRMPGGMDGLDLAREVRSQFPNLKVVLASAERADLDRVDHHGFFRKPYRLAELLGHIKNLIG